jgi:hypothetical protein
LCESKRGRRRGARECVFINAVPIIKLFAWGKGDNGGHVLRETTSRSLCGLVCPSRTRGSVHRGCYYAVCVFMIIAVPISIRLFGVCLLLQCVCSYKAVRVVYSCVFITAVPIIKLFARGEGYCVCLPLSTYVCVPIIKRNSRGRGIVEDCVCLLLQYLLQSCSRVCLLLQYLL